MTRAQMTPAQSTIPPVPTTTPAGPRALRRLPAGLTPRRAWPHRDGLAVETRTMDGSILALVVTDDEIRLLPARDRALPALAAALTRPGSALLGHRPGRRAVIREADGHYLKVVRPGRARRVADGLHHATGLLRDQIGAPAIPAVCAEDDRAGWVRLDPLPGPNLHELLRTDPTAATVLCRHLARAVAILRGAPPGALPRHTHAHEATLLQRWVDDADGWAATDLADHTTAITARLLALPEPAWAPCHRDLHDKQALALDPTPDRAADSGAADSGAADSGAGVGLLDLDTLCAADPALDPANLLAHLRLRTLQGHCDAATAVRCAAALADPTLDPDALAAYTAAALLRLAAVYAFRPGPPDLPARLAAAAADIHHRSTP